jgi:CHASE2 domain-containing sensor protein
MSGAELHANVARTALAGFPLRPRKPLDVTLIALLGLLIPVVSLRLGWKPNVAIALAAGALYVIAVQLAFDDDRRLPVVYPLLALVLTTLFTVGWSLRPRRG